MSDPVHDHVLNDGVELAITSRGRGPDLLFAHGLGSAQELWDDIVNVLQDHYRCHTLDFRGHGASARTPRAYGPDTYASDIAAALDHIGRPTIAIGHSLGGGSITRVGAAGHEHLVAAYVIDSTLFRPAGTRTPTAGVFARILDMLREYQPANRPVDDYVEWLGTKPYVGGGSNSDAFVPARLSGRAVALSQVDPAAIEAAIAGYPGSAPIEPELTVPLRVVGADPDLGGSLRADHVERLLVLTPHAEILQLTGVGHQTLMVKEYDQRILVDLTDWLTRVAP